MSLESFEQKLKAYEEKAEQRLREMKRTKWSILRQLIAFIMSLVIIVAFFYYVVLIAL